MKLSFSKPTKSGTEFRRLTKIYRNYGFEGLQLKTSQYSDYLDDPERFQSEYGDDAGLVSGLIVYHPLDDHGRQILEKSIEFARTVGSERVIYCQNQARSPVDADALVQYAQILDSYAREAEHDGISLSLHHHYNHPVMTARDITTFFESVSSPRIRLTVDTGHLVRSGISDIPAFIREYEPYIDNIHLKDIQANEWRILGDGELDLEKILDALKAIGYSEWVCIDEETPTPLEEGLERSGTWWSRWGSGLVKRSAG